MQKNYVYKKLHLSKYLKSFYWPAMCGTTIEYYDMALYGYMAPILVPVFLPHLPKMLAYFYYFLFEFFAVIFQILGARIFGYMGDHYGRKTAMYYAMMGISVVTFFISILPTYDVIGVWAAVLFVAFRALQSFFLGGEYNGGAIYCLEHEQNTKRHGLISGIYCALTVAGILMAALVSTLIHYFGKEYFRIAYALSFIFACVTYTMRKRMKETPAFCANTPQKQNNILKSVTAVIFASLFFGVLYGLPTRVFNVLLPLATQISTTTIMTINTVLLVGYMGLLIIFGALSDRFTTAFVMRMACFATVFATYPLILLIQTKSLIGIIVAKMGFTILTAAFIGPFHAWAQKLFAIKHRYTHISTGYAFGKCGSTILLALTINLFEYTKNLTCIAFILMAVAAMTLWLFPAEVQDELPA